MREFDFIEWVRSQATGDSERVLVGPGDDCAVLALGDEKLLVTSDQVLDGVHFSVTRHGPAAGGRKAAARNLSDIAAMAGEPVAMVATVAAPQGFSQADAQAIYDGLRSVGDEFRCPLVGGDLAAWDRDDRPLQISVTVLGRCGPVPPVLRSGAEVGDAVCVTGVLGGAWRTRRHLSFAPRIPEARKLATDFGVKALIDISDGLASDLGHIVSASGVAAEIDAAAVPIADDLGGDVDPLTAALTDGEDYELLFALPADSAERLIDGEPLGVSVTRIGTIVAGEGIALIRNGKAQPLDVRGWEHET